MREELCTFVSLLITCLPDSMFLFCFPVNCCTYGESWQQYSDFILLSKCKMFLCIKAQIHHEFLSCFLSCLRLFKGLLEVLIYFHHFFGMFFNCFSITTSAYIVVQFLKLSSQESSQDPMYYVLLRNPNKYVYRSTTI